MSKPNKTFEKKQREYFSKVLSKILSPMVEKRKRRNEYKILVCENSGSKTMTF